MDGQEVNQELESFREQWRAEVRARKTTVSGPQQQGSTSIYFDSSTPAPPRPPHLGSGKPKILDTDDDYVQPRTFDDPEPTQSARQNEKEYKEPVTALDHYERAVEKESAGSLGDSLNLYRKAYRVRATLSQRASSPC